MRAVDPARLTCGPDTPLRQVLEKLGEMPNATLIVVDGERRVLGTITDGDARRALLKDLPLTAPAAEVMKSTPVVGREGRDEDNARLLAGVPAASPALPITDAEGRLVSLLVAQPARAATEVLVMAGGFGRRLKERTDNTPKPLLPVGGKPILEHILSRLEVLGTPRIHISVHYLADRIEAFIAGRSNKSAVVFVHENEPLGTAGAITLLPNAGSGTLLLVNGDVITSLDFANLANFHESGGFDVTIAAATYTTHIPFGVLRFNDEGYFQGVDEKPTLRNFVAAGIYMLSAEAQRLVPPGQAMDMPELLNRARQADMQIGVFPIHEYWTDVGQPADLDKADAYHNENGA
ncbi:MAG: sugar phosphate nucleotidyltransferase [Rhodospirillaceae bacterium]